MQSCHRSAGRRAFRQHVWQYRLMSVTALVFVVAVFGLADAAFVGVEASYLDLGSPTDGSVTIETQGWSGFAMGVLPLGPVGLFAKVGMVSTDTEISSLADESSTDPAYGVGAEFAFSKIAIRAEYEMFDIEDTEDVYMVSVGAAWRF